MILLYCLIGYILGSIPYGLILVYIFKGIDIRTIGSKNIGATNVLRTGSKILALLTLLLDCFKGYIAGYLILALTDNNLAALLATIFAVIGHIFPVWLKFKGGKGVATTLGVILFLNPTLFIMAIITWLVIAVIFRYSSLSAIVMFILVPIYGMFLKLDSNYIIALIFISMLILYKHRSNIVNLINKQETKIKFKK